MDLHLPSGEFFAWSGGQQRLAIKMETLEASSLSWSVAVRRSTDKRINAPGRQREHGELRGFPAAREGGTEH